VIWHLLAFAAGVQLGLAVTLWRLGEQRQALRDEAELLDERGRELDRLWNIVVSERRGGCGR
jgi:RNAse (barnase) inhibitor barstar